MCFKFIITKVRFFSSSSATRHADVFSFHSLIKIKHPIPVLPKWPQKHPAVMPVERTQKLFTLIYHHQRTKIKKFFLLPPPDS